ncbi:hypothetical protein Pst134EB_008938 [Puccinia striiformis f. sp. tritici]|nr:hypothetical protein Pst134EB_008938 [Puccinia striiformis f. sp. tritici]
MNSSSSSSSSSIESETSPTQAFLTASTPKDLINGISPEAARARAISGSLAKRKLQFEAACKTNTTNELPPPPPPTSSSSATSAAANRSSNLLSPLAPSITKQPSVPTTAAPTTTATTATKTAVINTKKSFSSHHFFPRRKPKFTGPINSDSLTESEPADNIDLNIKTAALSRKPSKTNSAILLKLDFNPLTPPADNDSEILAQTSTTTQQPGLARSNSHRSINFSILPSAPNSYTQIMPTPSISQQSAQLISSTSSLSAPSISSSNSSTSSSADSQRQQQQQSNPNNLPPPPTQEKRSRAIRLTSSFRKAGNSLSPRTTTTAATTTTTTTVNPPQQRTQRTSRLFSSRSNNNSSTQTNTTSSTNSLNDHHSPGSPRPVCSVPMTPISPDCSPTQLGNHPVLAIITNESNPPAIMQKKLTSPELIPTPAPFTSTRIKSSNNQDQHMNSSPSASPDSNEPPQTLSQHPLPLSNQHQHQHQHQHHRHHSDTNEPTPSPSPVLPPSTPTHVHQYSNSSYQETPTTPTGSKHHPSQNILTIALSKAQTAVQLDTALQIPEAIHAYTEAVLLLEEVIDNIEALSKEREDKEWDGLMRDQARDKLWADDMWKRLGQENLDDIDREDLESRLRERERKWMEKQWKIEKRKKARADEEDRLVGIHNTYASRIAELQAEVLSNHHAMLRSDQSRDSSPTRGWPEDEEDEQPPSSNLASHHPPLSEAERTSFSSDSTTREGTQSQHLELPSTPQRTSHEQVTLASCNPETFRQSCEIEEEEKDVVSERLPHYVHSQSNRNRASSSISGASLSQLGRVQSNESMTTRRTSVSSNAYNTDQCGPTLLQTSTEVQFEMADTQGRISTDPRPTSRHSKRLSDATLASGRPESPRTTISSTNQHFGQQSSQTLLVSQTTTQGTISQRRRSPTCVDAVRRSPSRSQGHQKNGTVSFTQPFNPGGSSSMSHRPSNLSLMGTVPSAAIPLRLRSYSQPGKRPGLPPSFMTDNTNPVPNSPLFTGPSQGSISRKSPSLKHSSPLLGNNGAASQDLPTPSRPVSQLATPSPSLLNPTSSSIPTSISNGGMTRSESQPIIPTYEIQPYAHASLSPGSMYSGSAAPVGALPGYPKIPARRPFHLMRQIRTSISTGAYVSPRLYVPRQMWYQVQVKLHGLETKIKLMETLIAGLELVERDGAGLVGIEVPGAVSREAVWDPAQGRNSKPTLSSQVLTITERFMKRLEIFEELLDNLQSGGAKKLGLNTTGLQETAYGQDNLRKAGGFGTLMAHKLGKGLDRITLGRGNADLPTLYVDTIARLFDKSQTIDVHLGSLELAARSQGNSSGSGMYSAIGQQSKQHIEGRLRRVSEFYSTVVCRFVVADMGVLLDKYVKRGGNWCGD